MIPLPILKVLSTFRTNHVRALLIGGQACIAYGAVEFSRDSDFMVLVTPENLARLRAALAELEAEPVFFPPLDARYLRRGHACHFRSHAAGMENLRVDVMARLRGCDSFSRLWERRSERDVGGGLVVPLIGLRDLVRAKKTQRDKDWFMLARLVDQDILQHGENPTGGQVRWWLQECRTAETLVGLVRQFPRQAARLTVRRPALAEALAGLEDELRIALLREELPEREADRAYWVPLRAELEQMRMGRLRRKDEG